MKFTILTLGCKANQAESTMIEANLQSSGYKIVDLTENPDICIINTCTVTSKSDYQSRQLIRRAHRAGSKVVVTGCYSELNKDIVSTMNGVMMVANNRNKTSIINMLTTHNVDNTLNFRGTKSRFLMKVQDGCNYSCSYCVIPKARGRSRSIEIARVVEQMKSVSMNYNEVVLTGIHLGTYGQDLTPKVKLSNLVKAILTETDISRIRLSSLEINEVDEDLLRLLHDKRVCRHLHIPLQSGDNKILRLMNRRYDSDTYIRGILKILLEFPDISIGADVIAGFPGEGEEEFENTRDLIDSLPFSYLHVFPFSRRPGTEAANIGGYVDPPIKKDRCAKLIRLGKRKKREYMSKQIGKTLDALIEEGLDDYSFIGTTGNYLKVRVSMNHPKPKSVVYVRIDGCDGEGLFGTHISDS